MREVKEGELYWNEGMLLECCDIPFGLYPIFVPTEEKKTDIPKQSEDKLPRYIVQNEEFYKWTGERRSPKKFEYAGLQREKGVGLVVDDHGISERFIYVKFDPHGDLDFAYQETKEKIKECREAEVGRWWDIWKRKRYPYIAMGGSNYCAFCQVLDDVDIIDGEKQEIICKSKCPLGNGLCSYLMGNVRHAFCDTVLDSFEKGLDEWYQRWGKEKEMISSTKESWESNMGRRVVSLEENMGIVIQMLHKHRLID